jgi:hypothetical protein
LELSTALVFGSGYFKDTNMQLIYRLMIRVGNWLHKLAGIDRSQNREYSSILNDALTERSARFADVVTDATPLAEEIKKRQTKKKVKIPYNVG